MNKRIWFITGVSSGLGKALAETVIDAGDFVIGTFRRQDQVDAFNTLHAGRAFALKLDVTEPSDIQSVYQSIELKFGTIDVLVNNAGFGLIGAVEETSITEARSIFEVNVFGALQITQAFLPMFRKKRRGHIIQISSHGGFKAFAGFGLYNATKFALEGFSEALAQEIAPLGIQLTIVEPGPFRTSFAGKSLQFCQHEIEDYRPTAGVLKQRMMDVNGKQEGDPKKAARAILNITHLDLPPLRLPLGKVAIASISSKLESVRKDLEAFQEVAASVVYHDLQ